MNESKTMKTRIATLLLAMAGAAFAQATLTVGEVRKIDKPAGKITLKHGEIAHLEMPPMTMVFGVKDPALLERVKAGDKVRFSAGKEGGQYVVTGLEVLP